MRFEEFVAEACRTMSEDMDYRIDLYHAASGIVTEVQELEEAFTEVNRIEELGDICWYLALFSRHHDFNFGFGHDSSSNYRASVIKLRVNAINLLDRVKARVQYNRENVQDMVFFAERISNLIILIAAGAGHTMNQIFEKNINKLKSRYTKTFTTTEANNRNLEKEDEALRA